MTEELQQETRNHIYYLPLYKAAIEGNWSRACNFFKEDPNSLKANVSEEPMTALHVAIRTGLSLKFAQNLVGLTSGESLHAKDAFEGTPLHNAAAVGHIDAAKVLIHESSRLLQVENKFGETPLHTAAEFDQKDSVWYLLSTTSHKDPNPFTGQLAAKLLNLVLEADFYG